MTAAVGNPIDEVERLHAQRAEQFKALANRAAAGETIGVKELDAALTASSKTPAEYRQLVERIIHRNKLRAQVRQGELTGPIIEAAQAKLDAAEQMLQQEMQAARAKYNAIAAPLNEEIANAQQQSMQADAALRELRDTARDDLKKQLHSIQLQHNHWMNYDKRQMNDLKHTIVEAADARRHIKDGKEAMELDLRIAECQRLIEPIQAQGAMLQEQMNAISQAMLTED